MIWLSQSLVQEGFENMIDGDMVGKSPDTSQDQCEPSGAIPSANRRGRGGDTESPSLLSPPDKSMTDDTPDGTVAGTLDSRG